MKLTDERLAELIEECSDALQELAERRRVDAAVENAFDDPSYDLNISKSCGKMEAVMYDTAGERVAESFGIGLHAALAKLVEEMKGKG